jgi:hypothetical protein
VRCARVQGGSGGVLRVLGGSATFESVAISNTTARVRVAGEADRVGGGLEQWSVFSGSVVRIGCVQNGGMVFISNGMVAVKGGTIANVQAVRFPC